MILSGFFGRSRSTRFLNRPKLVSKACPIALAAPSVLSPPPHPCLRYLPLAFVFQFLFFNFPGQILPRPLLSFCFSCRTHFPQNHALLCDSRPRRAARRRRGVRHRDDGQCAGRLRCLQHWCGIWPFRKYRPWPAFRNCVLQTSASSLPRLCLRPQPPASFSSVLFFVLLRFFRRPSFRFLFSAHFFWFCITTYQTHWFSLLCLAANSHDDADRQ